MVIVTASIGSKNIAEATGQTVSKQRKLGEVMHQGSMTRLDKVTLLNKIFSKDYTKEVMHLLNKCLLSACWGHYHE